MKKNIIVTGAYGVIGRAICRELASGGHAVCMLGRDEKKLKEFKRELENTTGNDDLSYVAVDLSVREELVRFTESWQKPLHVLINNAATTPKQRYVSNDGVEMQFATNVLSYFRLIKYLTCIMNGSAPARVVNVSSFYAGGLDLDDLEFHRRQYDNDHAYRQSKQADRMLTIAFAEKLKPLGITVNSCHPGEVNTKLSNSMGYAGSTSPEEGASTPVFLALDPSVTAITGKFFSKKKQVTDEFAWDKESIERLYEICESYEECA